MDLTARSRCPLGLNDGMDRFSNSFKQAFQRGQNTKVPCLIRFNPFLKVYAFPTDFVSGIESQNFEENSLNATISFPEWVDDVQFTIIMGDTADKMIKVQTTKIGLVSQ